MGDGEGLARLIAAKGLHALDETEQRLAATGAVVQQVGGPGVDLGLADRRPAPAVPRAEVQFQQAFVDDVRPAPACEPRTHRTAARER